MMYHFNGINVLSLFDGISGARLALDYAGIKVKNYYASEIDKFAIQVSHANYPDIIQMGNIKNITWFGLPKIDLLIGGSPCQGFSFAGKQLNFDDPRSALFWEFIRVLKEVNPKYFLLENVRMKKDYQQVITDALGVEAIEINSSLLSAQNRKRLYWTNISNISQPSDKGILLKDIIEDKNSDLINVFGGAIRGRRLNANGKRKDYSNNKIIQRLEINKSGKSNCLTTVQKDNVLIQGEMDGDLLWRKLTPIEYERLQTYPDNYTNYISNSQRYKVLGNSFTVEILAHILRNI